MTIALTGSSQVRPTAKFKLQVSGSVLPGYCQALDDPLSMKLGEGSRPGRDGDAIHAGGLANRGVSAAMRVLTRLGNGNSDRSHLDDCIEQYRDALALVARRGGQFDLYLGDSDRYLPVYFAGASAPLAAPDSRAITYSLNFRTNSWYHGATATTNYRHTISPTRVVGTVSGSETYASGHFSGTQGVVSAASGLDNLSIPPSDNLAPSAGSMLLWAQPQYASTNSGTSHRVATVSGSDNLWHLMWRHTDQRFAVSGSGSDGSVSYVTSPATVFVSGNHVLLGLSWDNAGTRIYAGVSGSSVVTSSSATALFGNVGAPSAFYIGGDPLAPGSANAVLSDLVTFRSALTADQVRLVFSGTDAYDPFDTDLPTTMLLDMPLNGSVTANSSSNSIYVDVPAGRTTYPVVTIEGSTVLRLSGSDTPQAIHYSGSAIPPVEIDCGAFTVLDSPGTNKVASIQDVDFGIRFAGDQRVGLIATAVTGTWDATVEITPRYER